MLLPAQAIMDPKETPEGDSEEEREDDEEEGEADDDAAEHTDATADGAASMPDPSPEKKPEPLARVLDFLSERYRAVDPRWLGLFRICFGTLLISELLYRWSYARFLF